MPDLLRIHHTAIICSDYERSKRFYSQVLGLNILAENFRATRDSWKLDLALPDGGQIELFSFKGAPPRPSYPEAQGLRHLAFAVASVSEGRCTWRRKALRSMTFAPTNTRGNDSCFLPTRTDCH